jgi:hypothetical protein
MNNPEYILTDEMATVVTAVKTALSIAVLNYQFGYVMELNETLKQYEADPSKFDKKFPLVWLAEPYSIIRGQKNIYGIADVDLFIINTTNKEWKATERMDNNYKPVIFPIYRQLLQEIVNSPVFDKISQADMQHSITKGYYWGEAQQSVLNDAVDCLKIGSLKLRINNNQNCTPFKSF